jgi:hypothetical protein
MALTVYSQEEDNYIELNMDDIIQHAIQVSTEHLTEDGLDDAVKSYATYFYKALYTTSLEWNETTSINTADSDQFDMIKYSLLMIGRSKNYFDHYQYYSCLSFEDVTDVTIVFVFSDVLKSDFETWVRPGDVVNFYLQLASYELRTKVIIFVVNKYEV